MSRTSIFNVQYLFKQQKHLVCHGALVSEGTLEGKHPPLYYSQRATSPVTAYCWRPETVDFCTTQTGRDDKESVFRWACVNDHLPVGKITSQSGVVGTWKTS